MSSYTLPSRLEQPELLTPGRKPVGPVKIDWEHPLSRGLIMHTLPENLEGSLWPPSMGKPTTNTSTEIAASPGGLGRKFDAATDSLHWLSTGGDPFRIQNFTVMADVYIHTTPPAGDEYIWNVSLRADLQTTSGDLRFVWYQGAFKNVSSGISVTGGNRYRIVVTKEQSTSAKIYVDGVLKGTNTTDTGDVQYVGGRWIGWGDDSFSIGGQIMTLLSGGYYNRALSEGEAMSLSRDPYQFLKPVA